MSGRGNGKNKNESPVVEVIQEGPPPPTQPGPQPQTGKVVDFERVEIPLSYRAKVTLKDPRLSDVRDACEEMHREGVPDDAVIGFHKWTLPPDNYYLIATWSPHDGGRHQK